MEQVQIWLLAMPRRYKRAIQIFLDIFLVCFAMWLAFVVRLGVDALITPIMHYWWLFVAAPIISIPVFICFRMYRAVMRYFGSEALVAIVKAVTLSSLVLSLVVYVYSNHQILVPRSIIFNYWWLSLVMLCGFRLMVRQYFTVAWFPSAHHKRFIGAGKRLPKVAIYGAGAAGNQLVAALRIGRSMLPVAFIDDDSGIAGRVIAGLQVYKPRNIKKMIDATGAEEILLAIPSSSRARRREILESLQSFSLHVRSVPGFMDLASGRVKVDDIREVDIGDLLGRDSVAPQNELLERCIVGKVVMVTGAGGSIGSELCRQISGLGPSILILFEHSEFNLYSILLDIEERIASDSLSIRVLPILGSVRNPAKLLDVMRTWKVETVYHAAAYKHVPMVEHNIAEGVLNNVIGTLNAAQAALQVGVENFVLISTDKAVRPTNVMGSTKRLAEMTLQALSRELAPVLFADRNNTSWVNKTRFTMVRFGNVLGSSGSVIPLFYKQIRTGGPVTVTHPKITRYFMTIPEAAQLVIQAGSMGRGGDVFVLDMGLPVRIAELAEKMIHLSGLSVRSEQSPLGDISIEFTGLRPGEKLYEELLIGDNVQSTGHAMIMSASEEFLPWEELKRRLADLLCAVEEDDYVKVRQLLRETVSGYAPEGEIVDWIYQQRRLEP